MTKNEQPETTALKLVEDYEQYPTAPIGELKSFVDAVGKLVEAVKDADLEDIAVVDCDYSEVLSIEIRFGYRENDCLADLLNNDHPMHVEEIRDEVSEFLDKGYPKIMLVNGEDDYNTLIFHLMLDEDYRWGDPSIPLGIARIIGNAVKDIKGAEEYLIRGKKVDCTCQG